MKPSGGEQKEIWIGMVQVVPSLDARVISDASGAFVDVLTWAADLAEYRAKVTELMDDLRLNIMEIEKAEPLANRGSLEELAEEIALIAREVRYNPNAIMYSTFFTWGHPIQ